jgi:hypothetical protein
VWLVGALSQRARLMLDTVVDIKNNRRTKGDGARGGQTAALPPALSTYARAVSIERVALRKLSWSKILTCDKVQCPRTGIGTVLHLGVSRTGNSAVLQLESENLVLPDC